MIISQRKCSECLDREMDDFKGSGEELQENRVFVVELQRNVALLRCRFGLRLDLVW